MPCDDATITTAVRTATTGKCPHGCKCRDQLVQAHGGSMRATRDEIARLRRVRADATDKIGHCFEVLTQAGFSLKSRRNLGYRSTVVCLGTMLWVHGITESSLSGAVSRLKPTRPQPKDDGNNSAPGAQARPFTGKQNVARGWLSNNVPVLSCKSPTENGVSYLNVGVTTDLFGLYASDVQEGADQGEPAAALDLGSSELVTPATFARLFREMFNGPNPTAGQTVKTRTDTVVQGPDGCETCSTFDDNMKMRSNPMLQKAAKVGKEKHLWSVDHERNVYVGNILAAVMTLAAIMNERTHLIGDSVSIGMDAISSWFTAMPILPPRMRSFSRVQSKITMCLIHGFEGAKDYCLRIVNPGWCAGGANLQITNWLFGPFEYLVDMICRKHKRRLPATLHHQCDRGSDQVSMVWLYFWAWLEKLGVFTSIWVSSLQRWHSHFDADRMGATLVCCLLRVLRCGALTCRGLMESATDMPDSDMIIIDQAFDFVSFFTPVGRPLPGMKPVHQWHFQAGEAGHRTLMGSTSDTAGMTSIGAVLTAMPEGSPRLASLFHSNPAQASQKQTQHHADIKSMRKTISKMDSTTLHRFGSRYQGPGGRELALSEWDAFVAAGPAEPAEDSTLIAGAPRTPKIDLATWPPPCITAALTAANLPIPAAAAAATAAMAQATQAALLTTITDSVATVPHSDPTVELERVNSRSYDTALGAAKSAGGTPVVQDCVYLCLARLEPPYVWFGKAGAVPDGGVNCDYYADSNAGGEMTIVMTWLYMEDGTAGNDWYDEQHLRAWADAYDVNAGTVAQPHLTFKHRVLDIGAANDHLERTEIVPAARIMCPVRVTQAGKVKATDRLKATAVLHDYLSSTSTG